MTDPTGAPGAPEPLSTDPPTWAPPPPAAPTGEVTYSRRLGGPSALRIVLGAVIAIALLATAALAIASPGSKSAGTEAAAVLPPGLVGGPGDVDQAGGFELGGGMDNARAMGGVGALRGGGITITAISGSDLTLKTVDGWARTITVTSNTQITKGGKTVTVTDLAVGDQIVFGQTRSTDGTYTITAVRVVVPPTVQPYVSGAVTATTASSITVNQADGTPATITVDSTTKYQVAGVTTASLSDVKVGMELLAIGTKASAGTFTATQVRAAAVGAPGFGGGRGPAGFGGSGMPGGGMHGGPGGWFNGGFPGGRGLPQPSASPATGG